MQHDRIQRALPNTGTIAADLSPTLMIETHIGVTTYCRAANLAGNELDQYWLLLYEPSREGKITTPYKGEDAFEIMAVNTVSCIKRP